jgi:hypothetical protein
LPDDRALSRTRAWVERFGWGREEAELACLP